MYAGSARPARGARARECCGAALAALPPPWPGPGWTATGRRAPADNGSADSSLAMRTIVALALAASTRGVSSAAGSTSSSADTVLFVDDDDIIYRPQTERVLHPAQRPADTTRRLLGVLQPDRPWERALGYTSVHHADAAERAATGGPAYMLWYQCCPAGAGVAANDGGCVVCLATSEDGDVWVKPKLGLWPAIEGTNGTVIAPASETNIVLPSPPTQDGVPGYRQTHYGASVVVDPLSAAGPRRFKMAYWAVQGGYHVRRANDPCESDQPRPDQTRPDQTLHRLLLADDALLLLWPLTRSSLPFAF